MKISALISSKHTRTFLSFGAIQAMQLLIPLLAFPWLSRKLGEDAFGVLMYMCLTPPIVCLVMEWGITLGGTRSAARSRGDSDALSRLLGEALAAKIILAGACFAGSAIFAPLIPRAATYPAPYFLAALLGVIRGISPLWFYQGIGEGVKKMAVWDVLSSAAALAMIFLFINEPSDWPLYFGITAACKAVPYIGLNFELCLRYRPIIRASGGFRILKQTRTLFASSLFSLIYNNGSQLVLGYFLAAAEMGIIVAVVKMLRAVSALLNPFVQTMFPELCLLSEMDQTRARLILRRSLAGLFLLMSLCSCLLFFLAPYIIRIALGPGYEAAIPVFRIVIFAAPPMACEFILGTQTLTPRGLEKKQIRVQAIVAFASLGMAVVLGGFFGLAGAAWLPPIIETALVAGYFRVILKYCPDAIF